MVRAGLLLSACSGFLAVALGAFGSHGLAQQLSTQELGWWQTAVEYQFWHTLALAFTTLWLRSSRKPRLLKIAAVGFIAGILLFSGSLYLLALTGIRTLVWLTPLGGSCWLLAWACLGLYGWRHERALPRSLDE